MTSSKYEGPKVFLGLLLALLGVPYSWWANAYALEHIWNWYLPPFAPAMSFKVALGVSFVAWALLLAFTKSRKDKSDDSSPWTDLLRLAISPWIVLGCARIGLWMFFE